MFFGHLELPAYVTLLMLISYCAYNVTVSSVAQKEDADIILFLQLKTSKRGYLRGPWLMYGYSNEFILCLL